MARDMKRTTSMLAVVAMVFGAMAIGGCHRSTSDGAPEGEYDEGAAAAESPAEVPEEPTAGSGPTGDPMEPALDSGSGADTATGMFGEAARRARRYMGRWEAREERRERRAAARRQRPHDRREHPRRGRRHARADGRFEDGR